MHNFDKTENLRCQNRYMYSNDDRYMNSEESRENHKIPISPEVPVLLWGRPVRAAQRYFNENDGERIDSEVIIERIDWMRAPPMLACAIGRMDEWMKINPTKT